MKCQYCGADIYAGDAACGHCGSVAPPSPSAGDPRARGQVFARLKQSSEYADRESVERLARVPQMGAAGAVFTGVFFTIFIGASAFMAVMMLGMGGVIGLGGAHFGSGGFGALGFAPALMSIIPLGFVVLGVLMAKKTIGRFRRIAAAPVVARPAVVVGKRLHVSGGGKKSSASTYYHATFEFEDGQRRELILEAPLFARLAENDAGVLFSRAEWAADFDRVAI